MELNRENISITIGRIIARSISGVITPDEQAVLDDWLQDDTNRQIYTDVSNGKSLSEALYAFDGFNVDEGYRRFETSVNATERSFRFMPWMAAAGAVALILSVSIAIYMTNHTANRPIEIVSENRHDIPPGRTRATLTLADGQTITLDEARDGIVIGSGEITYNDGNPLVDVEGKNEVALLELSTPKGGTYQITLADGTKVWLNAASTLRYPSTFNADKRIVEVSGEAYFVVSKDENRPFRVVSEGQVIEVLGTEFNVETYADEGRIKTTLVEGVVQVENSLSNAKKKLLPGEQSTIHGTSTDVNNVSVEPFIAWKAGMFHFKHTPFVEMMGQIERWYDVEIVYKNGIMKDTFSGKMRRDVSLLTVLDLLKVSEIGFHLDGNKLIIE